MEHGQTIQGHKTRAGRGKSSGSLTIRVALIAAGLALGAGQFALGAYLASGNNGWSTSLLFSVVGLVGATLACFSWHSRRNRTCLTIAGVALGLGVLGTMGLMLDLSQDTSGIRHAWSQVPLALAGWMVLWAVWIPLALGRLLMFEPPRTRNRLSSRRGDEGS